jgi:hypothetical protein
MRYRVSRLGLVAFCLSVVGCSRCTAAHPSPQVEAFFRMDMAEQIRQFGKHSLEEQYELYEFGNRVVHPPAIYLARPFAEQGRSVVPFLLGKLKESTEGAEVRDIALVLSELSSRKLYDFSADPEPLQFLEKKAKELGGTWESTTMGMVAEMRGPGSTTEGR